MGASSPDCSSEYEEIEHLAPAEILDELTAIETEILGGIDDLKTMLG